MNGTETWNKLQPILWVLQDIADEHRINCNYKDDYQEIYVNVYNGLKRLDDIDKLKNEIKNMKRKAGSFSNSDYATGYISALSTIEGLLSGGGSKNS